MKKSTHFLSLLLVIGFFFLTACSDDDSKPANQVTVDGQKFKFTTSYIDDIGQAEDIDDHPGHQYQVILYGEGIGYDEAFNPEGEGDLLLLNLFSPDPDELQPGTYEIAPFFQHVGTAEFSLFDEFVILGGHYNQLYDAVSGTIVVKKSGDTYTFKFSIIVQYENEAEEMVETSLKGQFRGKLTLISSE